MEAKCSSETSVGTQRTTQRYVPEDGTLNIYMLQQSITNLSSRKRMALIYNFFFWYFLSVCCGVVVNVIKIKNFLNLLHAISKPNLPKLPISWKFVWHPFIVPTI
jgi:hypothetical protein